MGYSHVDIQEYIGGASVASGSAAATNVILGPVDLLRWPTRSLTILNQGTATLSGVIVQVNPDPAAGVGINVNGVAQPAPSAGLWLDYDTATFTNIGSGQLRGTTLPGLYRWWRAVGLSDRPGNTTLACSGYIYAASMV